MGCIIILWIISTKKTTVRKCQVIKKMLLANSTSKTSIYDHVISSASLNWNTWGPWSTCSATCLGGTRFRNRTCQNPICPQALAQEINVCNDLGCSGKDKILATKFQQDLDPYSLLAYPDYVIKEDGNQYRFSDTQATWSEARDACEATPGSRLAVPKSSAEFHAIFSFQRKCHHNILVLCDNCYTVLKLEGSVIFLNKNDPVAKIHLNRKTIATWVCGLPYVLFNLLLIINLLLYTMCNAEKV